MISIIVAKALNGVIGKEGDLPWKLSADLKRFARLTKGHTVIMGRKTYESIVNRLGHPLPERKSIVITSRVSFHAPGCTVVSSIKEVLAKLPIKEEAFVIGGGEIYRQFLPLADRLYVTEVNTTCDGDTFFPAFENDAWKEISSETHPKDDKNSCDFTFREFTRK